MNEATKPRRRIVASIEIEADDWRDLRFALRQLETDMAVNDDRLNNQVSGGYSSGWIVNVHEDVNIDHDSWAANLSAYLNARRAKGVL